MTIFLTKDCIGIIANYLSIKDAIKIALLNKEYYELWQHIKYEHVVKCQNLDVIKRNKNIKFSYESEELFDIPENLDVLDLSNTNISNISGFDVKNLSKLSLSRTKITDISDFDVKNLRRLNLSGTKITNISGFDVKNLSELYLSCTKITNKMKDKLREKVKDVF